ncbi:hypothetical protein BOX15_Mlig017402g2 [Macrostomum lignano]|uniref:ABC transporter domain-containing protein n=1 Tax=Macrostomum lignano TaxID=282301 RepID=A0A267GIR0_9PLAT|nr:hypothetical protein BOX15_Mlig017402g2 [Macrostomum lignano]
MPLDPSKKQPSAVPKPEQNLSAGGFFEQFVLLLLLLLKLKAWRLLVIVVPIALMMSNLYVLPIAAVSLKGDVSSSLDEINANKTVILYTASDFAASKSKVLVDRSAFPAEAAAATSLMTAAGGNADWIEDCGPETDCRERFNIHRTNPAIVALIRYSKTPEKSRTVLECLGKIFMPTSTLFRDIRCAFLYKVLILSTQKRLGLDRFADVQQFEVFYKDPSLKPTRKPTERNNIKKRNIAASISLPQSICAKYIKKNYFIRLIHATVRFTVSLAAGGVTFYMLISTITCVRALKIGGFLQRLFRSGLSVSVYWLVIWLITLVECLLFAGVFTASNALQCPGVFPASAMARLFVFLTLFCLNFAAVLLLLELLMPSTIGLSILATVISIGLLVTEFIKPPPQEKYKFLLYIFSPLFATEYITKLLSSEVRRQFSEIKQEDDNSGRLSQIQNWTAIGLLLLFLLLTYLDFILSSGNGLCLPPQYPFMPAFWSQRGKKDENDTAQGAGQVTAEKAEPHIEPVMGLSPIIVVNDITKTYRSLCFCCSDVPAVLKKLSCKIYRGQITALIGHNGAGKSTLVKILTGDELPDEGTAYIGGCLVTNPLLRLSLRGRISICPQFDDLCDALTVMDCIRVTMLSRLASKSELEKARSMLQRLGLEDKENVRSCDLSGGQKRKVSTILALLGDPDVVFLDEPTSGLDPVSRRQLWQLLQEEKSCRSIILCTQFMDEADILADRKIFLCGGKIVCAGSSMFLKQAFGCSFTLNVSLKSKTGVQPLLTKLKQIRVKSHIDTELQLEVPAMDSAVLTEAVQILETSGEVETFGLSQASLDDVFMRLGGMDSEDIIKAFRAGTLLLPQRTEILSVPVETPEVKEASDQLMTSSTKMRTFVTGQFPLCSRSISSDKCG